MPDACRLPSPIATHLVCKRRVIFCGERPIRSLILSLRLDTFALGDTERVNEGPIVGWILTEIFFAFSLLKVGVAMLHSFDGRGVVLCLVRTLLSVASALVGRFAQGGTHYTHTTLSHYADLTPSRNRRDQLGLLRTKETSRSCMNTDDESHHGVVHD